MRRCTVLAWVLAGLLTAPAASAAGEGPATRPRAKARGKAPKATTRPAAPRRAKADGDTDEEAVPQALIDASRRSFVVVRYHFRKDTSESLTTVQEDYRIRRLYDEYVDQKRPAEMPGIVLDDQGHVLVVDGGLEDRFLERIEVESGGKTFAARRARLLFDAPGIRLAVDAEAAKALRPVRFVPFQDQGVNTTLLQSALYKSDDEWRLRFTSLRPALGFEGGSGNIYFGGRSPIQLDARFGGQYTGFSHSMGLLADTDGSPVGCALTSFVDLKQEEGVWRGPDLRQADGIDWAKLQAAEDGCRKRMIDAIHEVVLVLRQGGGGEEDESYRYSSSRSAAGRETSTYGVAISPTEIVVLRPMDSRMARQIEKIYIKHSPTQRQPVEFVGAYKDIGGFVVRLPEGKLPAHVAAADGPPGRMRPFWMARLRKRHGGKYVDLSTNRLYGKSRGYEGKYHWYAARPIAPGTFLVDFDGRLVGAYTRQRLEHEEERGLETRSRYRSTDGEYRIYTIAELRDLLAQPVAHMDPKIQVKPKTLAKRRAWVGVEYVPMTNRLAEMLKLETPTKDGQLGFRVNAVYAGSPAEKLKLQVGDILLKLQAPGLPYPIELASRFARDGEYGFSSRWDSSFEDEDEMGAVEPTWRTRMNFLTRAFDAIGVGKTVQLTYFRPTGDGQGDAVTVDYQIELAPPDQESAPKWKNRKLGLTVKDVTYEVRHALNLQPPAGVIVAKVESGSPAVIAKVYPNEVITRLDDKPLASAQEMRDRVAAARQAGTDKVRLTILRLGKTRFADLAVAEYEPADDEGLEEDRE